MLKSDSSARYRPFEVFLESVEPCIRGLTPPDVIVTSIEPHLHRLISERDWLPPEYRRAIPSKSYAQYLLHRPDDGAFSIVSFVWNAGRGSPIHDHCTWGVIGQYEGEEEETRFRLGEHAPEVIAVVRARPGDTSHVYPPHRDIHQIMNRTHEPTISIHIYGGDIGSQQRHIYDPESGRPQPFVSGYDEP